MSEKREQKSLSTWDPFRELDLLESWSPFGARMRWPRLGEALGRGEPGVRFAPALDVTESEAAYVVTLEVPGAGKDDVTVEVHDNVLTLRGEKRNEREEKDERSHWVERSYGSFSRSFSLPRDANPDRIEAGFEDGVLTVTIPKTEETKPKRIAVKS